MDEPLPLPSHENEDFLAALNAALEDGAEPHPSPRPAPQMKVAETPGPRGGQYVLDLKNLNHLHEAIMNWMLANPGGTLVDCARHFGVSSSWLSLLKGSDLFKARFKEKQELIFTQLAADIPAKLTAIAEVGIDRLQDVVETSTDPRVILETTKMALSSLGFGKPASAGTVNAQNVQQNFYVASQADLVAARGRITGGSTGLVSDGEPSASPAPADATPIPTAAEPVAPQLQQLPSP